jgi:hypothetical protein
VEFFFRCTAESRLLQPTGGSVTGAWFVGRRRLIELSVFPIELSAELASAPVEACPGVRYFGQFR